MLQKVPLSPITFLIIFEAENFRKILSFFNFISLDFYIENILIQI